MQGELKVFHKIRFGSFLSVVCFISASCGTSESGDTSAANAASQGSSTMFVTSQGNLPLCETAKEGQLAYVNDDKSFYSCSKLAWIKVEIKGDKGDPGSQGVAGTAGKDGVAGAVGAAGAKGIDGLTNKILSSIRCNGDFSTVSSLNRTLNGKTVPSYLIIKYTASVMTNGDVFATANIRDGSASYGNASFYSVQQNGASNASVTFNYDAISPFTNGGWWNITVNRNTGVATARYSDGDFGLAPNYLEWDFLPSACTKQTFN